MIKAKKLEQPKSHKENKSHTTINVNYITYALINLKNLQTFISSREKKKHF